MCVPILTIFLLKLYVLHISAGVFVVLRPFFLFILRNFYIYEPLKIFYCIYISLAALWFALLEISVSVYVLLSVCARVCV